jgi:hypothetical protein
MLSGAMDALIAFQDQMPQGPQRISQAELWGGIEQRVPWFQSYMFWTNVVSAVLCVAMIVGAIGLLRLRLWGWYLSLAWALASLGLGVVGLALMWVYIGPAMNESYQQVLENVPPPPPGRPDMRPILEQSMNAGMTIGLVTGASALLYPLVMLIVVCLPSMRAAFRPEPNPPATGEP